MKKIILIILIFGFLTGCITVPMATEGEDKLGKRFKPHPNKASIYVFQSSSFDMGLKVNIFLDGDLAGQTAAYTYALLKVRPGDHTISSSLENIANLNLHTEAGKLYFIKQEVNMGAQNPRVSLHQLDSVPGQTEVMKCKLISSRKTNTY